MGFRRKNLLLLSGFSLILPACAPSLPMLAIGAAAYIAQTQLSTPQATEKSPAKTRMTVSQKEAVSSPVKTETTRQQEKTGSPAVVKKNPRGFTEHCRRVSNRLECTRS